MNRADFQALADVRIDEAQALLSLNPPRPDGAYYLAGYAVECALKAAIAKLNNQHDWPDKGFVADCHTHSLKALMRLANLETDFKLALAANPALALNWNTVTDWSEKSRYERHALQKAQEMVVAVADNTNGVLPWIRGRW